MSRENILIKTSWISTIGNAILSASKIFIGLWAGSLAVVGDGIDSATDVVISIVMIFTARLINRPPSKKYVFGYEKAEGIATKILSLVIFYAGMQMLISSIQSIFSDEGDTIGYRYLCDYILYCRQTDAGFVPVQTGKENRQFHADGECDKYA